MMISDEVTYNRLVRVIRKIVKAPQGGVDFSMYSPQLLDHFQNPRNVGEVEHPDASVRMENPVCGDLMHLTVKVKAGRLVEVRFRIKGCVAAIACGSALSEIIEGRTLEEARTLKREDIVAAVGGLPPQSHHAGSLVIDALAQALAQIEQSSLTSLSPQGKTS